MAAINITFELDIDTLSTKTDAYLAQLWHIAQANPAPFGDAAACDFAEAVGREIIARWLAGAPVEKWTHQGRHVLARVRCKRIEEAVLYEHSDGRRAAAASAEAATFTHDDPSWYRAGPVDVSALCGRSGA